jgi:hypothetical protein
MAEKRLQISKDLSLSSESVTNTELIVARRRVGKTYTGSVYAEELMEAGLPFCALDPTGAWWGLASSADGKREGYPVVIIGGPHGHLPLEVGAGRIIANMVADNPAFYIIDFSRMDSENDIHVFAAAFGRQIMKRQQSKPSPLKLIIDEADMFVPQKPANKDHISCFRAYDAIVRRGGINGLGVMLITQRPALINTDVRTQCETLIALTISAPHDQDPVLDWVSRNGTKEQLQQIRASLASLSRGQAWYFSPNDNIFQLILIRERRTFNSSATPKPGAKAVEPKVFSKIDLDKLGEEIKNTVERSKMEDPDYWRRQNADLQRKLTELEMVRARAMPAAPAAAPKVKIVEKPVISKDLEKQLREVISKVKKTLDVVPVEVEALNVRIEKLLNYRHDVDSMVASIESMFAGLKAAQLQKPEDEVKPMEIRPTGNHAPALKFSDQGVVKPQTVPQEGLNKPQQKILDAIAWMETVGIYKPQRSIIASLAGYSMNSTTFTNPLGNLRSFGYLVYPDSETAALTEAGRTKANIPQTPATTEDLHRAIFQKLNTPQTKILRVLINAFPAAVNREDLASQAGYSVKSTTFTNPLGNLRSFGFIDYPSPAEAIALPILFLN